MSFVNAILKWEKKNPDVRLLNIPIDSVNKQAVNIFKLLSLSFVRKATSKRTKQGEGIFFINYFSVIWPHLQKNFQNSCETLLKMVLGRPRRCRIQLCSESPDSVSFLWHGLWPITLTKPCTGVDISLMESLYVSVIDCRISLQRACRQIQSLANLHYVPKKVIIPLPRERPNGSYSI